MYLTRKADAVLTGWKAEEDRYPLIVRGARQIGKTETIRKFGRENYTNFIEINFITSPEYRGIIDEGYSAESVIRLITRLNPKIKFIPHETLLFFDEIQAFPEMTTALKFFKEDGRYDVICSGSLLGIQYKHIDSISVGSKKDYQMFSLDFEEFLWGYGYSDAVITEMITHMLEGRAFSSAEHSLYSRLFLEYCILGGMPKVLATFFEKKTFEGSLDLQRQLLIDYEGDARKYAEGLDQAKIIAVLRSIPAQLAKENKKFQYARVSRGGRAKDYMGCIEWLADAGIINICQCMRFPELPIKGNVEEDRFKLYYADTGLLVASLDDEAQLDVRANRNLGVYKGALYENFAAEALVKQGYPLCYYKKENSTLEEDFFVRTMHELIPVEVKAANTQAKSLIQLISSTHYPDIHHGIKFISGNIGINGPILSFPHYCMFLLKRFLGEQEFFS